MQVEGKVQGGIGYSSQSGVDGQLTLASAALKFPDGSSAQFDSAQMQISNDTVVLAPSDVEMENGQSAQIEGEYALDNSHSAFRMSTRELTAGAAHLLDAEPIPLFEQFHQGASHQAIWKGWISYEKTAANPGVWSGQYDLQNAVIPIPGLASPVRLASATVQMNGDGIQLTRMRGRAGTVKFEGDYRYDASAPHPHRLRLTVPELQLTDLEGLMLPALRRDEGFLARAFRRDQPLPKWLEERNADVTLQVMNLINAESPLGDLTAHAVWRGASIAFSSMAWHLDSMHATGKMSVSLAKAEPTYDLNGTVENFDYRNGQLDIDGELQTRGIGADLLVNLRSKGTFDGRGIMLAPDADVREVSGSYRVGISSGLHRLLLSNLQVLQGAETLVGQGASQPDGHIVLELASGRKQVRLTGMLLPVHPDPAPAR